MEKIVGVDIGCTKMYMYAEHEGKTFENKVPTGLDCPRERLKQELDAFIERLPFEPEGVGMAVPGLVEGDHRVQLSDVRSLSGITADYFGGGRFPVRFINDVKSATVAETVHYKDKDTLAVIMARFRHCARRLFEGADVYGGARFCRGAGLLHHPNRRRSPKAGQHRGGHRHFAAGGLRP